jgi:hypothetical protein
MPPVQKRSHDVLDGLDLVDVDGLAVADDLEHVAERRRWPLVAVLLVQLVRVSRPLTLAAEVDGLMQELGHLLVVRVVLEAGLDLEHAARADGRHHLPLAREVARSEHRALVGEVVHVHAADARHGALERDVNHLGADAVALEDLRAVVRRQQGDAHLGQDFLQAGVDGSLEVALDVRDGHVGHLPALDGVLNLLRASPRAARLEREPRVHRGGAVPDEARDVVGAESARGLDDDGGARPEADGDEVVVHRADGEEGRNGGLGRVAVLGAISEDHALRSVANRGFSGLAHRLDGVAHGARSPGAVVARGDALRGEALDRHDGVDVLVEEHGGFDVDGGDILRALVVEKVPLGADGHLERHDETLAQGIDRRVGHLREPLLEVVVQEVRAAGEHGHGRVVAHRPRRLAAIRRHRLDDHGDILRGVPRGRLRLDQSGGVHLRLPRGLRGRERLDVLEPRLVIAPRGDLLRHLGVFEELARLEICLDHLPRPEPPLGDDVLRVADDVAEDAHLGGDVDVVVRGAPEARGPEAVAVEPASELLAVGEDEERGAVPRLLHPREVVVKLLHLGVGRVELRVVPVRLRHEQHHRLRDGSPGLHEELRDAVEVRRVGRRRVADGPQLLLAPLPHGVGHVRLLRGHPVQVSLQGVNLAVVPQESHRLRERPLGHGVRGEAAVVDAKLRLEIVVLEILVKLPDDGGAKHPLVHDRPPGHRAHVEVLRDSGHLRVARGARLLRGFARDVELALELVALGAGDQHLRDDGLRVLRHAPHHLLVHGHVAPRQDLEALRDDGGLEQLLALGRLGLVLGQEDHADARGALGEALDAVRVAPLAEHLPRDVAHDPRAVARIIVRGARAAVLHASERGQGVGDGLVRLLALEGGDEADAARVALLEDLVHVHRAARVRHAGLDRREDVARAGRGRGGGRGLRAEPGWEERRGDGGEDDAPRGATAGAGWRRGRRRGGKKKNVRPRDKAPRHAGWLGNRVTSGGRFSTGGARDRRRAGRTSGGRRHDGGPRRRACAPAWGSVRGFVSGGSIRGDAPRRRGRELASEKRRAGVT